MPYHLMPGNRVRLGPLVLMVREAQVDAAGVDVDVLAEVVQRQRRALGVPAGEPGPPRGGPGQLAAFRRGLPQRPVGVEPLVALDLAAGPVTGAQVVEPVAGQLAVSGEGTRIEI